MVFRSFAGQLFSKILLLVMTLVSASAASEGLLNLPQAKIPRKDLALCQQARKKFAKLFANPKPAACSANADCIKVIEPLSGSGCPPAIVTNSAIYTADFSKLIQQVVTNCPSSQARTGCFDPRVARCNLDSKLCEL